MPAHLHIVTFPIRVQVKLGFTAGAAVVTGAGATGATVVTGAGGTGAAGVPGAGGTGATVVTGAGAPGATEFTGAGATFGAGRIASVRVVVARVRSNLA